MRIAAHIGVKDEVELIERCITHLRAIGVSEFIVCDVGSTDGTGEILDAMKSGTFHVVRPSNADSPREWLRTNEEAIHLCDADWLAFLDADEFILPASGWLPNHLGGENADLIEVPRYNVPMSAEGPLMPDVAEVSRYRDVSLIVEPIADIRGRLKTDPGLAWIRAVPVRKVIVRPALIAQLTDGMHEIIPIPGVTLRKTIAEDIVTAHLALTTKDRFLRKIENIREVFRFHDAYFGPNTAWHWRRWLELADAGAIEREFQRSHFTEAELDRMRREGVIKTAADVLRKLAAPV